MVDKPSKTQPVLLGGLVLGLGSVIPFLSLGNLCCCGWAIVGGAFAAYLLIKRSPILPIKSSDGAAAGAVAGVVGSFIYLVIGVPLMLLEWSGIAARMNQSTGNVSDIATREAVKQLTDAMQGRPAFFALGVWIIFTVVSVGMATLGGMIGVAMFEKRKGGQPPPTFSPVGDLPAYGVTDSFATHAPATPAQPPDERNEP